MNLSRTAFLCCLVLALVGCGAPKKKQSAPPEPVNRVGIVSLLPSAMSYQKFGITKFNNEIASRPVGDVFNTAARAGALSALRMGSRAVIQVSADVPKLVKTMDDYPGALDRKVEQIEDDLLALVAEHKLDAMVLVVESFEKDKPVNGIRVVLRAGLGSVNKVEAQPHIAMLALDKNAKLLGKVDERSFFLVSRPGDAPWEYKLDENLLAATHEHLTKLMQNAIESAVEMGVMSLNF